MARNGWGLWEANGTDFGSELWPHYTPPGNQAIILLAVLWPNCPCVGAGRVSTFDFSFILAKRVEMTWGKNFFEDVHVLYPCLGMC